MQSFYDTRCFREIKYRTNQSLLDIVASYFLQMRTVAKYKVLHFTGDDYASSEMRTGFIDV